MKKIFFAILFLLISPASASAEAKTIHVLVALCDNVHQGIVPVSKKLGDGDDLRNNLYWGAMYGVSTFMKKHPDWQLLESHKNPSPEILERLIFRKKDGGAFLVADAYAGRHIKKTTQDFFDFAAGLNNVNVKLSEQNISLGGKTDLLVYMGHNGLMDFDLNSYHDMPLAQKRDVVVFSCISGPYFAEKIKKAGSTPYMMTNNLMAPEAYILLALAEGWLKGEKAAQVHERVAAAYNKYQKCGMKAARGTFTVKYAESSGSK